MEWYIGIIRPPPLPAGRSFLRTVKPGKDGDLALGVGFVSWRQAILTPETIRKSDNSARVLRIPSQLNWRNVADLPG
jgi:hypothetical protein